MKFSHLLVVASLTVPLFMSSLAFGQDLSRYGDAVVTDSTTEKILDHAEYVAFDQNRNEWVLKVQSPKNPGMLLETRYPRTARVFVEDGELIPIRVNGKRVVRLFQLYTDRVDIPIEYYISRRDKAYQASIQN